MDTRQFLQRVLGGDGRYCIFAARKSDERIKQEFYTSIDDLVVRANELDDEDYDVFYGLATYGPEDRRKVDNAVALQSFFLDLDCGKGKAYPTQGEALKALQRFCKQLDLSKPQLVNSGRGIHAYWFLDAPVDPAQWRGVAERLKKACEVKKLDADPAVTADVARVLRVPGTHNHKGDPLPVQVLGKEFVQPISMEALSAKLDVYVPNMGKKRPVEANALMNALTGNRESSFKTIMLKTKAGKGCDQLKYILRHQDKVDEPLWRAGLSIAKFTKEGTQVAHLMSKGHPDYDPAETEDKLERIKGPYLCSSFNEYNPGICEGCPNFEQIRSPITLGNRIREHKDPVSATVVQPEADGNDTSEEIVIPKYPAPYFRGANGGVYIRSEDDDGIEEDKLVYINDLYATRRLDDPELGECIVMRLHMPMDGVREFTVPLQVAISRDEFKRAMARRGVFMTNMDGIVKYMKTWIDELQLTTQADMARRQFGWTDENCSSFVIGDKEIFPDRTDHNAPSATTGSMFPAFRSKGTLQGWVNTANFFNKPGMELHQYIVLTSFASVMMESSSVNAVATHIWSKESGLGKTTAMLVAAGAWGRPKSLIMHRTDTINAKMMRGEIYHNIPMYLDEITNMSPDAMSEIAYQFAGGQQKDRMKQGTNELRHRGEEWKLMAVTTGNVSFHEKVAMAKAMGQAEAQRVLEIRAERFFTKTSEKALTDKFAKSVEVHYGHAGIVFVRYYMQHREQINALVDTIQTRIDTQVGLTAENRFWSEGCARVLAALVFCRKLGLLDYDSKAMFKWIIAMLRTNLKASQEMTYEIVEIVGQYMNDHHDSILRIKSTEDRRTSKGEDSEGVKQLQRVMPEASPRHILAGRYETDVRRFCIMPKVFRKWCADQQLNYQTITQELMKQMGGKRMKIRYNKGTSYDTPPQDSIVVTLPESYDKDDGYTVKD